MGYDSDCTMRFGGRTFTGKARLEQAELVFRGETRLVIPLNTIDHVEARDGELVVTFGDRDAVFAVGAAADRWARRIERPPSRVDKLGVKEGMRVGLVDIGDTELQREIALKGASIERDGASALDVVLCRVQSADDLDALSALVRRIKPAGAVWVIRRKGRDATVSETDSMAAARRAGLVDVKVVSFSGTHSAEKYVIPMRARATAEISPEAPRARADRSASPSARTRGSGFSRGRTSPRR